MERSDPFWMILWINNHELNHFNWECFLYKNRSFRSIHFPHLQIRGILEIYLFSYLMVCFHYSLKSTLLILHSRQKSTLNSVAIRMYHRLIAIFPVHLDSLIFSSWSTEASDDTLVWCIILDLIPRDPSSLMLSIWFPYY